MHWIEGFWGGMKLLASANLNIQIASGFAQRLKLRFTGAIFMA